MSRFSTIQRVALLLFVLAYANPGTAQPSTNTASTQATTQATQRVLPQLAATPAVIGANATVTLQLAVGVIPPSGSRIALFEAGRPTRIAEIKRDFQPGADGTRAVTLRVSADPGLYEWRVVTSDKNRTPLTAPALLQVSGVRREAGWWLVNGSPFVSDAALDETRNTTLQFLPGLQRPTNNKNFKAKNIATTSPLTWRVLDLPLLSTLTAPGYNFANMRSQMTAPGSEPLLGFALRVDTVPNNWTETSVTNFISQLRQSLQAIAPGAAFISVFNSKSDLPGAAEWLAARSDAVVMEPELENFDVTLWQLKTLRRVAEEQPGFDLPIFIRARNLSTAQQIDVLASGATGFIGSEASDLERAVNRNLSLFVGSATFEDLALWPNGDENETNDLYTLLRDAGRIPLLGRLKDSEKEAESLAVVWNDNISAAQIEQLRKFANAGARIFITGAPSQPNSAFQTLVGASIMLRAVISDTAITLDDPWIFGALRGKGIPIRQGVAVSLKPGTVGGQARAGIERGRDVATGPRAVATLPDGSPGVVLNAVGKGEVIWLPHPILVAAEEDILRGFYRSIAERVQPSLTEVKTTSAAPLPLRTALRRSAKGTLLLSIINRNAKEVTAQVTVPTNAAVALDLISEREAPVTTRGFASTVSISIPATTTTLIAFGASRTELDAERFAARLQAKLR